MGPFGQGLADFGYERPVDLLLGSHEESNTIPDGTEGHPRIGSINRCHRCGAWV